MTKRNILSRGKLRANPADVTMQDVQILLECFGFVLDRVSESHFLFTLQSSIGSYRPISIPLHGRKLKRIYIQRIAALLDEIFPKEEDYG